jgi:hypothetical protein
MTRGLRNNNPLNIRHNSANHWKGLRAEQTDKEFCQFESMRAGVRAALLLLLRYRNRYHKKTIGQIIRRWAPPTENDTPKYVLAVCQMMKTKADAELPLSEYPRLLVAMAHIESGAIIDTDWVTTIWHELLEEMQYPN